jgi:hypothetical protein
MEDCAEEIGKIGGLDENMRKKDKSSCSESNPF